SNESAEDGTRSVPATLHPWNLVQSFQAWIAANMTPQRGPYTGVIKALRNKLGDCEEMAGIMVALCRASGIPARLVWVPNHNWAEFYLTDHEGEGHWIPAHTSCYAWLGWTGVHELVIQKGDRVTPAHEKRPQRLLEDWLQWIGKQPRARYLAELTPVASPSGGESDAGPGARSKVASGEWKLAGTHPMDRYLRNG
ncbi:MAG TPA: transglutaminase-like domain-containing protein, partial [Pirellulaceae bacterium]|nr:transglutaminase-like domain-containing protein [Pirellulaceae bacterium]